MPYNPGVQDVSGQLLGRGIASAGENLGSMLDKWKQEAKETKVLREALATFMPDQADKFKTMGHEQLKGQVMGLQMQATARQQQSRQTEEAARMDLLKSQMAEQTQRTTEEKASAIALQRFRELNGGELPEGFQGPPRSPAMEGQQMVENAGRAGLGPDQIGRLATGIAHLKSFSPEGMKAGFEVDPKTGHSFAVHGGQMMPSGVDPDFLKFGLAHGLNDEAGNPTGVFVIPTPQGGMSVVRPPRDTGAQDAKANVGSLFEGEKILRELDDDLQAAKRTNERIAAKEKGYEKSTPYSKAEIDELRARRERVKRHLDALDIGSQGKTSLPGYAPAARAASKVPDVKAADGVRADFKAGKITKEEAVKRLKEIGYQ